MYETVELEKFKVAALQRISPELAKEFAIPAKVDISLYMDFLYNDLALRVIQEVYGRDMESVEAKWPADWWQAFKERWYPAWAKKRWPVKLKQVLLVARELYPKISLPHHEHHIRLFRFDDTWITQLGDGEGGERETDGAP